MCRFMPLCHVTYFWAWSIIFVMLLLDPEDCNYILKLIHSHPCGHNSHLGMKLSTIVIWTSLKKKPTYTVLLQNLCFCLLTFGGKAVRSSYDSSPYVPVPIVYTFLPLPKEESNTFKTWQWSLPIIQFTQFKWYKPPLFVCERPALRASASLYTCHM